MSDIVISVENLWKQYRYGVLSHRALYKDVQSWWARFRGQEDPNVRIGTSPITHHPSPASDDADHFWALRDVSFDVKRGEVLGIIGKNGAGKSTLLKIMSRVTTPTKGQIKIKGRIASLLEVGTGFHPELTGRENIFLNGAILGMTKAEIKNKFDEIVGFAEVEKFIDTPVKRYSSGMYVRLAFAVAAHLEPEILIIDEVLAVGDASFQKKCLGKMGEVAKEGRTVLFVSHNMAAIENLCKKSILLENGSIFLLGKVNDVISRYTQGISKKNNADTILISQRKVTSKLQIVSFDVSSEKTSQEMIQCGASVSFAMGYRALEKLYHLRAHIVIDTHYGDHILYLGTDIAKNDFENPPSEGKIVCTIPKCSLMPGQYIVNAHCVGNRNEHFYDEILNVAEFRVIEGDYFGSGKIPPENYARVLTPHDWVLHG